jgi:hypothetical protein
MDMSELDEIFNEFARAFVGVVQDGKEIAFPGELKRDLLDGSVESLHEVDRYLGRLHEKQEEIAEEEWPITLLRAGAYVGEVIRHAAPAGEFEWVDYDEYMPAHPDLRAMIPERTAATCAFLVHRSGGMSMPLNKVARFISEGPENSVHYFAVCDLKRWVDRGEGAEG